MAGPVITWAYGFDIHYVDKFVLVTIADDADKVGTSRYLGSLKTIGKQCCLSDRQIRRCLRHLETWGLIRTYPQQRLNGSDTVHIFHCQTSVDATDWNTSKAPPDARPKKSRRPSIMSTFDRVAFWKVVREKTKNDHVFHTWLAPLGIVAVQPPRIVFRVPNMSFADPAFDNKATLLSAAKEIDPKISKVHILLPKESLDPSQRKNQ